MNGMKLGLATLLTTLVAWSAAWADQGDQHYMDHMGAWGWGGMIIGRS